MLSREENDLLCRVSAGTPMGTLMRRYWLPALLAEELPVPDCPPLRLRLLGEDLVAFRDSNGHVGVLEEACPHRRASLWLGRNEEAGLRCVYHGWKFDVNGGCLEQMNEPVGFEDKVRAVAYPAVERGGVIWVYMGPAEHRPPDPDFEWTRVPAEKRVVSKVWEECSWLQALEGGIDSSHAPILHRSFAAGPGSDGMMWRSGAPVLEVEETDYGYNYVSIRTPNEQQQYVRGYHLVLPFTQLRPGGAGGPQPLTIVSGHHWVPIDDYNCLVWNWHYSFGEDELTEDRRSLDRDGDSARFVDARNQYRAIGNRRNDWLIDRSRQRTQSFTGIEGAHAQDRAVQESMGPVVDRSREHLGPADRAIIIARRILLDEVRGVTAGAPAKGADAASYRDLRAAELIFPKEQHWSEVLRPMMYPQAERPVETATTQSP